MPVERFWLFEKNISRIESTKNMERLNIQAASQSKNSYDELHARYKQEIGVVSQQQPKLDREGLNKLKDLQQGPIK